MNPGRALSWAALALSLGVVACNAVLGIDELPRKEAEADAASAGGPASDGSSEAGISDRGMHEASSSGGNSAGTGGSPVDVSMTDGGGRLDAASGDDRSETGGPPPDASTAGDTGGTGANGTTGGGDEGGSASAGTGGSSASTGSTGGSSSGTASSGSTTGGSSTGSSGSGSSSSSTGVTGGTTETNGSGGPTGGSTGGSGPTTSGSSGNPTGGSTGSSTSATTGTGTTGSTTGGPGIDAGVDSGPPCRCGDGVKCGNEACDDGYRSACGTCNADCTGPGTGSFGFCGDGITCPEAGEACDDGKRTACGSCNADCTGPGTPSVCGDGILCEDTEACDDHFNTACGPCNADCTGPGTGKNCTDQSFCPDEETDTDCGYTCGTGTCVPGQKCTDSVDCNTLLCIGPGGRCSTCGNGLVASGEKCDGTAGLPAGGIIGCIANPDVNACKFDLGSVPQLYCNAGCSWAGAPGCDQADADVFCQLKTGWPNSVATTFTASTVTAAPGFACANSTASGTIVSLGTMPEYGIGIPVLYDTTNLQASYFGGNAITSANCTRPPCGDGVRQTGEDCDGSDGLPAGGAVACRPSSDPHACKYDFSRVTQIYCGEPCSWGGTAGCDQYEADLFCKLKLGSAAAHATSFTLGAPLDAPGFACPTYNYGVDLGPMPEYGVNANVRYHPVSILRTAPSTANTAAIVSVVCTGG